MKEETSKQLQVERHMEILSSLRKNTVVKVEELSELLKVSSNTIRRDLTSLEEAGLLRRTQGGAMILDTTGYLTPFQVREKRFSLEKQAIAKAAFQLIKPGNSIIMDAGTTMVELAKLFKPETECTLLTNSIEIGTLLQDFTKIALLFSGGSLIHSSRCLVGDWAERFFESYNVDVTFLSVHGVSATKGITNLNVQETAVKQKMVSAARRVVVLADSSKLGAVALSTVCPLEKVDLVITDWHASEVLIQELREASVEVIKCPTP